ncbi:MAG: hypothetical protein U1E60_15800 [Reyranellaceae bacterium]
MYQRRFRYHLISGLIGMVFLAAYYEITGHMPYRSGHAKGLLHQSQDAGTPPK